MSIPRYVQVGEQPSKKWADDVVSSIRKTDEDVGNIRFSSTKTVYNPFDPISVKRESAGTITIRIEKGFFYDWGSTEEREITFGGVVLSEYPDIAVPEGKDLFFNWKTRELIFDNPSEKGNLKILRFKKQYEAQYGGDVTRIVNMHPTHVDIRGWGPLTPVLVKDGSYVIGITPGHVIERKPAGTADGAKCWDIKGLTLSGLTFLDVADGKQLTVTVKTKKTGDIGIEAEEGEGEGEGDPVTIGEQDIDKSSDHWYPPAGDDEEGHAGEYNYKICTLEGGTLKSFLAGSHIDHFQDIPYLKNTTVLASSGCGRIIQEYNSNNDWFMFRTINQRDGVDEEGKSSAQIKIIETGEKITVQGNSLSGKLLLLDKEVEPQYESEQATVLISWDDGLVNIASLSTIKVPVLKGENGIVVKLENNAWTISLSSTSLSGLSGLSANQIQLSAGTNITIDQSFDNVYTISNAMVLSAGDGITIGQNGSTYIISTLSSLSAEQIQLSAGEGITINQDGNTYIISANLSSLSAEQIQLSAGNGIQIDQNGNLYTISTNISGSEQISLSAGEGITITQDGNTYVISTNLSSEPMSGNGVDGSIYVVYGNDMSIPFAVFGNGLYESPGESKTIAVPRLSAGKGISITAIGTSVVGENYFLITNTCACNEGSTTFSPMMAGGGFESMYTSSASTSWPPQGWEEAEVALQINGVTQLRTILVKSQYNYY